MLKICLKRDQKVANYKGSINQTEGKNLDQSFKFVVRLEVTSINFLDEDPSDKLIVHSKPTYIENDQNLNILFKSKFIHMLVPVRIIFLQALVYNFFHFNWNFTPQTANGILILV